MSTWDKIVDKFVSLWQLELFNSSGMVVHLNQVVIAITFVAVGIFVSRKFAKIFSLRLRQNKKVNKNLAYLIERIINIFLMVVIVLIALPIAGIPITIFTVLGGALAIGVGFGAQNLFNNLISGFILMVEQPIRIGDIVEVGGCECRVMNIGNRCVRVLRSDGVDVLVPNSRFLEENVVNWTLYDGHIRGTVSVGVAYGSPTQLVKKLILQVAENHPEVLKDKSLEVFFEEFGDNSLLFELIFWTSISRPMDLKAIQSDIRFEIDRLFREHNISISFPQRDVHLDTSSPLEIKLLNK